MDVATRDLVTEALAELTHDRSNIMIDRVRARSWICQSCGTYASNFYCADCVSRGNFTSGCKGGDLRLADRRLTLLEASQQRLGLAKELLDISEDVHTIEDLQRLITRKTWIVRCLQLRIESQRKHNQQVSSRIEARQSVVDQQNLHFETLQENCTTIKKCILTKRENLDSRKKEVHLMEVHIVKRRQSAIKQLTRDIFPLVELDRMLLPLRPTSPPEQAEYCRILEPILPLDGNYMAYHNYATQKKEQPAEVNVRNPLYEVPAGLGMLAQLVSVLVQILDFQMPDLLDYGIFFGQELDESSFQKSVYQLNWNILTLMSSQGLKVEDYSLKETTGNLLKLIKWNQLGRTGPYDLSNVLVFTEEESSSDAALFAVQDQMKDMSVYMDDTVEVDTFEDSDWETIPVAITSVLPSANPQDQMARSTFGTAVSGITSLFRSTVASSPDLFEPVRRPKF